MCKHNAPQKCKCMHVKFESLLRIGWAKKLSLGTNYEVNKKG